jgi:hypothetical protein
VAFQVNDVSGQLFGNCKMASVTLVPPSGNDYHAFPSRISSAKCSLARKASAMIVSVTDFSG